MAQNIDTNRPTVQFIQATAAYNTALESVTKLAAELFPINPPQPEETAQENSSTLETKPSTAPVAQ